MGEGERGMNEGERESAGIYLGVYVVNGGHKQVIQHFCYELACMYASQRAH
jgi:hypothetical protein